MRRFLEYCVLFVAVGVLQLFLFDNFDFSVWVNPLFYISFIALLPMETRPVWVLGAALAMGLAMDMMMGGAGLNTAATLPVAFLRLPLLDLTCGKENVREGGVPSVQRLGAKAFARYTVVLVLLHGLLFFLLEAMSLRFFYFTLLRTLCSGAVTWIALRLLSALFTAKVSLRR